MDARNKDLLNTKDANGHPLPAASCSPLRHLDLFSGIGGFALAARMVGGIETVGFCEIDPWAQKVLAKNFPGIPIHDDVKKLSGNEYGAVGIITGGYPCQPFSLTGKRKGERDDRHLWPEMRRIIACAKPRWILCENVIGHITMGLDEVLSDLESIGYSCGATVLPACAVDARHRRDRVWILGNREGEHKASTHDLRSWEAQFRRADRSVSRWRRETDAGILRVADGIPNRVDRIRGLGNAICPPLAAEIIQVMMQTDILQENDKEHLPR